MGPSRLCFNYDRFTGGVCMHVRWVCDFVVSLCPGAPRESKRWAQAAHISVSVAQGRLDGD